MILKSIAMNTWSLLSIKIAKDQMKDAFAKQFFSHKVGYALLFVTLILIAGCQVLNQSSDIKEIFEDHWIVSGVARLYQSRNDISYY